MFGMNDPAQTLMQLENYINDGRFEMSEVMATQFTEMLLNIKKRSNEDQLMLCLLYTSPSPRDTEVSRMPSSA